MIGRKKSGETEMTSEGHIHISEKKFTRKQKAYIAILTILALFIRLFELGKESFWYDESFSALLVTLPFGEMVQSMLEVGLQTSPFYYILLRPFASAGFDEFNLRLLSVIVGVLSIPYIAALGRIGGNNRVGILAATLLTINPFHVWYSREARLYSMLFFIAIASMYYFSRNLFYVPKARNWIALAIFVGIGFNLHHFAFFIPLIQFTFLLLTFKQNFQFLKDWLLSILAAGLLFIPWVLVVLNWGKFYGAGAGAPANIEDLFLTLKNFAIGNMPDPNLFVTITVIFYLGLLVLGLSKFSTYKLLLVLWLAIPPIVTLTVFSRFPMYMDRYLIVSLPPFFVLLAQGVTSFRSKKLRQLVGLLVITSMLFGLFQVFFNDSIYEREDWRSTGRYLGELELSSSDEIYIFQWQNLVPLYFYYHGTSTIEPIIGDQVIKLPPDIGMVKGKIWLVIPNENETSHVYGHCDPFNDELRNIGLAEWRERNSGSLEIVKHFECIRVELYQ